MEEEEEGGRAKDDPPPHFFTPIKDDPGPKLSRSSRSFPPCQLMSALKGNLHQRVWRGIRRGLGGSRCRRCRSRGAQSGWLQLCGAPTPPSSSAVLLIQTSCLLSPCLRLLAPLPHPLLSSISSPIRPRVHVPARALRSRVPPSAGFHGQL